MAENVINMTALEDVVCLDRSFIVFLRVDMLNVGDWTGELNPNYVR